MRIIAILLRGVGIFAAMLLTPQTAFLAPLFVQGETESFRYTAQLEGLI